jgi:dTDP-4-amino-4,6-dideoxygalactose transaminase
MTVYNFIQTKHINLDAFSNYLQAAINTNQFTNYGYAVQLLEQRARAILKIENNKAVIAVNNGAAALHAIISSIIKVKQLSNIVTQAFTFPCAIQGSAKNATVVDFDSRLNIDLSNVKSNDIIVVTNCFGHLQDLDYIFSTVNNNIVIFDNAATPYTFWKGSNSCNYGTASFVSLHHTKPLGFGEGGLVIIDKEYEDTVRAIINFDKQADGSYSRYGNNYKMSELAAAGILQWWDQFDIDELAAKYKIRYFEEAEKYAPYNGVVYPNYNNDNVDTFFPNCLPLITSKQVDIPNSKKYYKPLDNYRISNSVYDNIICIPLAD